MLTRKRKSRHLATISLAVMGAGFVATLQLRHSFWGVILQGGFEAGLVGGLADWFAVTALFRHPLGIPIPHTALLPKNRTKITGTIISMLENDWLTKESIRKKIDSIDFTGKLFTIVEKEVHSQAVQKILISLLQHLIRSVEINKLAQIIEQELKSRIIELNLRNYLPLLIDQVKDRKYDEKTLDFILQEIDEWAQKETTKYNLGSMAVDAVENIKADGFMQFALKSFGNLVNAEKLGNIIQNLILKGVASYRDPNNQNRKTLLLHIHKKLENLKRDEKIYEELNQLKAQLVAEWEPQDTIVKLVSQIQQKACEFVESPVFYEEYILPSILHGVTQLKADDEKVTQLETWIKKQISGFVENNHSKIGKLVEENLNKLDDKTLISMIENGVGKDLQWIRVNGAVCGFLIGLILVGIKAII